MSYKQLVDVRVTIDRLAADWPAGRGSFDAAAPVLDALDERMLALTADDGRFGAWCLGRYETLGGWSVDRANSRAVAETASAASSSRPKDEH